MKPEEIVIMQLEQFYKVIREDQATRTSIRNWCITIWLAMLAVIGTGKLAINVNQSLALSVTPVFLFWLMECFHHTFITTNEERATTLERMLAGNDFGALSPSKHFFVSGYASITFKQKMRALLKAMFTKESVWVFYLLLCVGSFAFVVILR